MIAKEHFNKIFHTSEDTDNLYLTLDQYDRTKSARISWPSLLILEHAHKFLGFGSLNKSCGNCIKTGLNKILSYLNTYITEPEIKIMPKITKKKVKQIAKQTTLEESINEVMDEKRNDFEPGEVIPTNYMALKKYAENKLGKKYPKGTKSATIRKDLKA